MKKYFRATYNYIRFNWMSVLLHVILPAVIFTIFINPTSTFDFLIKNATVNTFESFADVFTTLNDVKGWQYVLFLLLTIFITLVMLSSYIGRMQNRMRFGRPVYTGFKGILIRTNENILPVIGCAIAVYAMMELFAFFMSLFLFIIVKLTKIVILRIVLAVIIASCLIAFAIYWIAWGICTLPNMTMRGMNIFKALSASMKCVGSNIHKVFGTLVIPLFLSFVPIVLFSVLDITFDHIVLTIIRYIFVFAFYIFSFSYYLTAMYAIFFDLNDIEREDINLAKKWRVKE